MHTSGGRWERSSEEVAPSLTQTGISVVCVDESNQINTIRLYSTDNHHYLFVSMFTYRTA